jgi:hypothetical protein
MEHVIASYLRKIEGQHGFSPVCSCESQIITVCRTLQTLDNGDRIDAITIDLSMAMDLVPHDRLLTEIAASGVDSRLVVWIGEFLLGPQPVHRRKNFVSNN